MKKVILPIIFIIITGFLGYKALHTNKPLGYLPDFTYKTTTLTMGRQNFTALIADTSALQELGLSYRPSLPQNKAMLFAFATSSPEKFWMKGMNFPLDIIWLSADKKIIYIAPNLSPDTYPESFSPDSPVQYVIEVNAGTAARLGLKIGDTVQF